MDQSSFLQTATDVTGHLSGLLWNNPLTLFVLLGTGVFLTLRLRLIQLRAFFPAMEHLATNRKAGDGEISHAQALSTALSATIGTGNIAGVATAISFGGPGALFWMWVTAFLGMATKFTEATLAVNYREMDENGHYFGGPMYTLRKGMNSPMLGGAFAFFAFVASFGIGNMVQANSVVDGLTYLSRGLEHYRWLMGLILAMLTGMVILGGIRRIAAVTSALVPLMAILYFFAALTCLVLQYQAVPSALHSIFEQALNPWAAGGGAIGQAIRWGVARGLFSNEAGLGSSPIAHATARTPYPAREGLIAMLEPFFDTLVICSLTGLVIITSGVLSSGEYTGAALTAHAFSASLGSAGGWVVGVSLSLFAFSTIIAWSYYGETSARYLFGSRSSLPYRLLFCIAVALGAAIPLKLVWNVADIFNLFMAFPNIVGLWFLSRLAIKQESDGLI